MPWDPKPEPPQPAPSRAAPTLVSNGHAASPPSSNSTPGPQIKQDVPSHPQQPQQQQPVNSSMQYPTPQFPSGRVPTAQERAAMNLHQAYGNRAGSQIAQLQQQNGQPRIPMQQAMRQQPAGPYIKQEDGAVNNGSMQEYKPDLNQSAAVRSSQTDGSTDEYLSEVASRRAATARNQGAGDRLMQAHFRATQQELEGGGLLMPLDQHHPSNRVNKARQSLPHHETAAMLRGQGDAAGDDDEDADEDAINSSTLR